MQKVRRRNRIVFAGCMIFVSVVYAGTMIRVSVCNLLVLSSRTHTHIHPIPDETNSTGKFSRYGAVTP